MSLPRVESGAVLADEALQEPPKLKWGRQESNASTAAPGTPEDGGDFGRMSTPLDSDLESENIMRGEQQCCDAIDFFEARGGMASRCSEKRQACDKSLDEDDDLYVDFYEARGGLAYWPMKKRRLEVDPYEARGGMANQCSLVDAQKVALPDPRDDFDMDFLEARGGFISWATKKLDSYSDMDPFEARGGMAAKHDFTNSNDTSAELKSLLQAGQQSDMDLLEVRGGLLDFLCGK